MEWTSKTPDIPGWYWNRSGTTTGFLEIRFVHEAAGRHAEFRGLYSGWRISVDGDHPNPSGWTRLTGLGPVLWCGPVRPPVVPLVKTFQTSSGSFTIREDGYDKPVSDAIGDAIQKHIRNSPYRQKRKPKGGA